jgi:FkbM family methyltransferase
MRLSIIKDFLKTLRLYNSKFKNPFSILLKNKTNDYPIDLRLKNNGIQIINNFGELLACLYDFDYDSEKHILSLQKMGYPAKLYSGIHNGEIVGIFFYEDYQFLINKSKEIIDIGANIADSAIYFALEGADSVIAIEPYLKNYEIAIMNVQMNNLESRIKLLHAACGSKDRKILIDSKYEGVFKPSVESSDCIEIDCLSLKKIINLYGLESPALKIDCEGCEYELILDSDPDTIQKFSAIQIEYHYGCDQLKKRLHSLGFKVWSTNPRFRYNKFATNRAMYVGWLYAENKKSINKNKRKND